MIRFLPKGWLIKFSLIIFSAFLFGIIGTAGILLIIDGVNADLTMVIFGTIIIILAILIIALFAHWFLHTFRLEINTDSVIAFDFSVHPRCFIHNEYSLKELDSIKVTENRIIILSYADGRVNNIKLNLFSQKQIAEIESEILKRACLSNWYVI